MAATAWIPPIELTVSGEDAKQQRSPAPPVLAPVVLPLSTREDAGDTRKTKPATAPPRRSPPQPAPAAIPAAPPPPAPTLLAVTGDGEPEPEPAPMTGETTTTATPRPGLETLTAALNDRPHPFLWFLGGATVLFLGVLVQDSLLFLERQWSSHPFLGLLFTLPMLVLFGSAIVLTGREVRRYRSVRDRSELRREAERLARIHSFGQAPALLQRIELTRRADGGDRDDPQLAEALSRFRNGIQEQLGDRELLHIYANQVLPVVDDRAYRAIVQNGAAVALITGLSPLAWLDALLFLWRNTRMVRQIAEIYGIRPGLFGSMALVRQAFQGLALAGVTELVADAASDSLGDSLATVVVARAGQGIANGLFLARIGLQAMALCRPIPFETDRRPGLNRIRKEFHTTVKQALEGRPPIPAEHRPAAPFAGSKT